MKRATDPVLVGVHPRDDVRFRAEGDPRGTAYVHTDAGLVAQLELGDLDVRDLDLEVGARFEIRIEASNEGQTYTDSYRFRATRDEHDVVTAVVGPGIVTDRGRWGRKVHRGFEFGVVVMGAVLAE